MNESCKVCRKLTNVRFNIGFKKTPICETCADAITGQQVQALIELNVKQRIEASHLNK